ncbi:MAG: YciI family protein [Candidatus Elarobacter sp.]
MQYMLLIYSEHADREPTAGEEAAMMEEYGKFSEGLRDRNAMIGGQRLSDAATATTVRVRGGNRVVTDGPVAETKEWLAGYFVIEAPSRDGALEAASLCPGAKHGAVEIRPIVDMGG